MADENEVETKDVSADGGEQLQAKTVGSGIRVALGASGNAWDEWIEFKRDWEWADRVDWDEAFGVAQMRLLVGWTREWRVKDKNGALIPFQKDELLKNIRALNIGMPKVALMIRAVYRAFGEAQDLPLA